MTDKKLEKKSLSIGVEETAESAIYFVYRLFNTVWVVLSNPRYSFVFLERYSSGKNKKYVLPATFLAICFFLYIPVVEMTNGLIYEGIWLGDDTGQLTYQKVKANLSLTSVVFVALPGVITVYAVASILSNIVLLNKRRKQRFRKTFLYLTGYQCFAIFFFQSMLMLEDIDKEYRGFGVQTLLSSDVFSNTLAIIVAFITLTGLVFPVLTAIFCYTRHARREGRNRFIGAFIVSLFCLFNPVIYTFSANFFPSIIQGLNPEARPKIDLSDHVVISSQSGDIFMAFMGIINNPTEKPVFIELDDLIINFKLREEKEDEFSLDYAPLVPPSENDYASLEPKSKTAKNLRFAIDREEYLLLLQLNEGGELCYQVEVSSMYFDEGYSCTVLEFTEKSK